MTEPVGEADRPEADRSPIRRRLVTALQERGCVRSPGVADAFAAVPRECFLPRMPLARVYAVDQAIPTRFDEDDVPISSSSAPTIMAVMLEMLAVDEGQRVLEVGAGTGYNAALLSHLVGRRGSVTSIDFDRDVAGQAADNVAGCAEGGEGAHGVGTVRVVAGDGWLGRPGERFDRMIVTAECWDLSPAWMEQLAPGGLLVVPLWLRPALTVAAAFEKVGTGARPDEDPGRDDAVLVSRALTYCGFMPLRGPHEGPPRRALLGDVPWDIHDGDEPRRRRWIAHLDDATDERVATLTDLLRGPSTSRSVPAPDPWWRVRLSLEQPDPVCIFSMFPPLRDAFGLFDAAAPSLAVLAGGRMHCFGQSSCGDRLEALLCAPAPPVELSALTIRATSHRDVPSSPPPESGPVLARLLARRDFDFDVREGPASASAGPPTT